MNNKLKILVLVAILGCVCLGQVTEDKPQPRKDLPLLYGKRGSLNVGAAEMDISPKMGCQIFNGVGTEEEATAIQIPLKVKAIVLNNGKATLGLMLFDNMQLNFEFSIRMKNLIQQETGVDPGGILASATHTHSGVYLANRPDNPGYLDMCVEKGAACFKQAFRSMKPAEMYCVECDNTGLSKSRRYLLEDGRVITNPTPEWKVLGQATKPDPQMLVLLFRERKTHKMIATYANFSMHYVATCERGVVSAGYFGAVSNELRKRCNEPDMIVMMSNGPEGDMTAANYVNWKPFEAVNWYANEISDRIYKKMSAAKDRRWQSQVELGAGGVYLPFTRRRPTPEQLAQSEKIIKKYADNEPPLGDLKYLDLKNAREMVKFMKDPPLVNDQCFLMMMRIGDIGIAGLPGEPMVEYGLRIKKGSPFKRTLVVGLANGSRGYVATDEAIDQGGYEASWISYTCAAKGTMKLWVSTAIQKLKQLTVADNPAALESLRIREESEQKKAALKERATERKRKKGE